MPVFPGAAINTLHSQSRRLAACRYYANLPPGEALIIKSDYLL